MTDDAPDLAQAQRDATLARQRLTTTLTDLQAKLKPRTLARDTVQRARDAGESFARDGLETAKRHPKTLIGIVTAIALFAVRRPLRKLLRRAETPKASLRLPAKPQQGKRS